MARSRTRYRQRPSLFSAALSGNVHALRDLDKSRAYSKSRQLYDVHVWLARDLAAEPVLLTISAAQGAGRVRPCQTEFGTGDRDCWPTRQFWDDGA
jgi:hypothetical protein